MARPVSSGKMAQNQAPPAVLFKLILFAVLMAVVPIGTYFSTLKYFAKGSTTISAIAAIVAANVILIGYVVVAFREDDAQAQPSAVREKIAEKKER